MISPVTITVDPCWSAGLLQEALRRDGIKADVHDGYGLALVSVWVGLVVWCDGGRFWWRTGWNAGRRRVIYAWHPAADPFRAARRIAMRYEELRTLQCAAAGRHEVHSAEPQ
ncbi:hypothetical protein ETD86_32845 [Nonomuraea turkmeniaca]|uniref:Uncharacterized protein n=1 Tax=Nonomuraea turkmeniaca TaxID=103838 RepID=A0A5S4F7L1_9ACTN|nr:hypothetical protein [Nonomuraea turkmeniaca]TMR12371.1 hypothetical protein ETD86_32845 [Nonomuraea turkmeniaca]